MAGHVFTVSQAAKHLAPWLSRADARLHSRATSGLLISKKNHCLRATLILQFYLNFERVQ
jgi:hypothetical protein